MILVLEVGIEPVVGEGLALEEGSAVAVEAIGPVLLAAGIILGHEQLEAALLLRGELAFAFQGPVELRIKRGQREQVRFERERRSRTRRVPQLAHRRTGTEDDAPASVLPVP